MKTIIAGGAGFIGSAVARSLSDAGHEVIVLSRTPGRALPLPPPSVRTVVWDPEAPDPLREGFSKADVVLNFTGESLGARRWSAGQKALLISSRLDTTRAIVGLLSRSVRKPSLFVNASAVGFYGPVAEEEVNEETPAGTDFLADLCVRWEQEALRAEQAGVRTVILRMGVVLGKGSVALKRMLLPFRLFAGGTLGTGRQWFPWVHVDDVTGVILSGIRDNTLNGPINVVSPGVVRMREFCRALGTVTRRPSWAPVPPLALRAVLGEMADMITTGQRAVPAKLLRAGYHFRFPELIPALTDILSERR